MFSPEFFGKSPPRLFLGQVPLNQVENKRDGNRWGDRVKVRIVGYHSPSGSVNPDDDLPWGIVLKPTSQGTLSGGSTGLVGGEWVVGFFINDGGNKKNFMIIGVLGRSSDEYEVTEETAAQNRSTGFGRTKNYFGEIQPQPWQTLGGEKTQASKTEPTVPPPPQFALSPDSQATEPAPSPPLTVDTLPSGFFVAEEGFIENISGSPVGEVNDDGTVTLYDD